MKIKRKRISLEYKKIIYIRSGHRCQICGCDLSFEEMSVDHIIPLAKGGDDQLDNLQCACKICNSFKQDLLPGDFYEKIVEIYWQQTKIRCGKESSENLKRLLQK